MRLLRTPAALAAATGVAAIAIAGGGDDARERDGVRAGAGVRTAPVERRSLVEREDVDGTLGYAGTRSVLAPGGGGGSRGSGASGSRGGTITRLPAEGSVVRSGQSLYEVDGKPTAWLLRGRRPAWRDFERGMSDGEDVRQLEQALKGLGHDPYGAMTVDDDFDAATVAAIERFEEARALAADGRLGLGEVVFLPHDARIAERKASVGAPPTAGQPVLETTSTRRVVTVELEASRQALARRGRTAEIELPDGRRVRGRITGVSRVARDANGDAGGGESGDGGESEPTVEVAIALRARLGSRLDQAPVTVSLVRETRRDVLTVPVTALLALEGGRYAVEVVRRDGERRPLPVDPGAFADGYVEVAGRGLRAGMRVAVPDEI